MSARIDCACGPKMTHSDICRGRPRRTAGDAFFDRHAFAGGAKLLLNHRHVPGEIIFHVELAARGVGIEYAHLDHVLLLDFDDFEGHSGACAALIPSERSSCHACSYVIPEESCQLDPLFRCSVELLSKVPLAACPSSHGSWLTGEIIAKDHRDYPHSFHEAPGAGGISHNQSRSRGGGKSGPADFPPSLFASCQTALAGFPRSRQSASQRSLLN